MFCYFPISLFFTIFLFNFGDCVPPNIVNYSEIRENYPRFSEVCIQLAIKACTRFIELRRGLNRCLEIYFASNPRDCFKLPVTSKSRRTTYTRPRTPRHSPKYIPYTQVSVASA